MGYGRKAWDVVGWTYDADVHCPECAWARFAGREDFINVRIEVARTDSNAAPIVDVSVDGGAGTTCRLDSFYA